MRCVRGHDKPVRPGWSRKPQASRPRSVELKSRLERARLPKTGLDGLGEHREHHGDDHESALSNIKDAMRFWIDRACKLGRSVPEPKGERLMPA